VAALAALCASPAWAGENDVVLLPTVAPAPHDPTQLRRPSSDEDPQVANLARQLDCVLGEAAQDLGLVLDVSERARLRPEQLREEGLLAEAREAWVVSPRLEIEGGQIRIRILAVAPGSQVLMIRTRETDERELEVSAMVMLRDLVVAGRGGAAEADTATTAPPDQRAVVVPARSSGRAVLALHGALLGGYVGFSLQRASGSDDARLLYPLIALGTGVGLGGSMIVASEWDIGLQDAWYLSAGMWWPTAAGLMLADAYDVQPVEDRYVYGLVGAASGTALATIAISVGEVGEGSALLTHSGGAWGTVLGGLAHMYWEGTTEVSPTRGMGYGAGIGVLAAGVAATQLELKPSRILLIDLLAGLGGLTGAAVASPLVFGDAIEKAETRGWLASIAGGTLVGAAVGLGITAPSDGSAHSAWHTAALPYAGLIAPSAAPGLSPPVGGGVHGVW
jgi:hypothetical protein